MSGDEEPTTTTATVPSMGDSRYPRTPQPAVLAVVPRDDLLLLVRRANPPDAGKWGFPGGRVALGEGVADAAVRELVEETGVVATAYGLPGGLSAAFASLDVIDHDTVGAVRYHFVLTAVLCQWKNGDGVADDDATDCAWMSLAEICALADHQVSEHVATLARLALGIYQRLSPPTV